MVVEDDDQVIFLLHIPKKTLKLVVGSNRRVKLCSLWRVASRNTPSCSSWPAPRAANTCGSAQWRATPSFACASRLPARRAAATSRGSAPASDSGRAQRSTPAWWFLTVWPSCASLRWDDAPRPTEVVGADTYYRHMGGIMCHIKQFLCSYGYWVAMVTCICSYGDWDIPPVLFVFLWLLLDKFSHLKGTSCHLLEQPDQSCVIAVCCGLCTNTPVTDVGKCKQNTWMLHNEI